MVEWEAFTGAGHTAHTGCCTNPSSSTGLLNGYRFWGWELQGITLNPPLVGALPRLPCMVPLSSPDAQACPPSCALSPGFPQSTPVPLQEALAPSMPPAGTPPPPEQSCLCLVYILLWSGCGLGRLISSSSCFLSSPGLLPLLEAWAAPCPFT